MCIICNAGDAGMLFLNEYAHARHHMKRAADAMLLCSATKPGLKRIDQRKQYNKTHKRMVRLIREWNRLEQFREVEK